MLISQWNINIDQIMARFGEDVRKKAERVTQQIYDGVVEKSPVRLGQFRASWNISEGAPNFRTVDVGGTVTSPLSAPRQKAQAISNFPIMYIVNGKPYAEMLESGSSKQAPLGMVRVTLASLQ